jgi:DNA polymerase-1
MTAVNEPLTAPARSVGGATVGYEPLSAARAHLIRTTEDCFEFLRWLSTRTEVSLDTETTGLNHDTDQPRLVQIGDAMDGWAIPAERALVVVEDAVARFEGYWRMHNATFDQSMLANVGIVIPPHKIKDTRLMAHVLESTGSLELKKLAEKHVDPSASSAQAALDNALNRKGGWTWGTVPYTFRPYWVYGALDPILTYRLCDVLEPRVMATAPLSYQIEFAVQWITERMSRNGVAVDQPYTSQLLDQYDTFAQQTRDYFRSEYGINPGSDAEVSKLLMEIGALRDEPGRPMKRTATGRVSVDKEVLAGLSHPIAEAVVEYRQATKLTGTYLHSYLSLSERDGRIHPSINTVGGMGKNPFEPGGKSGVRTGRMSCSDPNLQNVPKHTKETKAIRNCFEARCWAYCGCGRRHAWLSADYDQIEMRIFTHLSADPKLVDAFRDAQRTGVDMFTAAAREIFTDPEMSRKDERRQSTKNGFYAELYGAGPERFAKTARMFLPDGSLDIQGAQTFLRRLEYTYPGIKQLQGMVEAHARRMRAETGVASIRSPLTGREFKADRGREYALSNYLIQGLAGEILKMKIIELDRAGLGPYMVLPVHDEVDFDVPEEMARDAIKVISDVMNDNNLFARTGVPITSSVAQGPKWGEIEDVTVAA